MWLVLSGLCGRENVGSRRGGVVRVAGRDFPWAVLSYAAAQSGLAVPIARNRIATGSTITS